MSSCECLYKKRYTRVLKKLLLFLATGLCVLGMELFVSCDSQSAVQESATDFRWPPFMVPGSLLAADLQAKIESLTMDEQIGQTLLIHLRWVGKDEKGWILDAGQKKLLHELQPGGVVLYAQHMGTIAQTQALIASIREQCRIAPFIAIDEEGGRVSRLASDQSIKSTRVPPAQVLGKSGIRAVSAAYRIIGRELQVLGFNMDFAPVADLGYDASNAVIGDRSFGTDPVLVAAMVKQAVLGLQNNGVCAVIKHFPGHGRSSGDSHFGKQTILADWNELRSQDIIPFQAAISEGVGAMMTAHIEYPKVDSSALPVSLSKIMLQDKLRKELHYEGLIITDALDMQGVKLVDSPEEIALQSLEAGVDMLLSPESPTKIVSAIRQAIVDKRIDQALIQQASRRVLMTKNRFGILSDRARMRPEWKAKIILGSEASRGLMAQFNSAQN